MTLWHYEQTRKHFAIRVLTIIIGIVAIAMLALLSVSPSAQASMPTAGSPMQNVKVNSPTDCGTWSIVSSPNVSPNGNILNGVKAISNSDIWAVGQFRQGPHDATYTLHWDGTAWTQVPSPNPDPAPDPYYYNILYGVDGIASNDVWAVGQTSQGGESLHWDGTSWTAVEVPDSVDSGFLRSVKMISHNDVWAVALHGAGAYPNRGRIIHWDGTQWSLEWQSNDLDRPTALYGVTAVSANDVWAVGSIVLHYDGTAWSEVPSARPPYGFFQSALALSANNVWAVGVYVPGTYSQTYIAHYDGTSWSQVPSPNTQSNNSLYGISGSAPNDLWAVGYSDPGSSAELTLTMHWDGAQWTIVDSPNPNPGLINQLNGVTTLPSGDQVAVGVYYQYNPNLHYNVAQTLIEQYTAGGCATPTVVATATPQQATATATATACQQTIYTYTDVPPCSTFSQYVECLSNREIVGGNPCGGANEPCDSNNRPYFHPYSNLTRGQLAKIVALAAGYPLDPHGPILFTDVLPRDSINGGNPFFEYINALAEHGVLGGYACGGPNEPCDLDNRPYFRTYNYVTRGQLAKIVSNAAGLDGDPGQQLFQDVPVDNTFYPFVQRLAHTGAIGGYDCGEPGEPCVEPGHLSYFRTGVSVTRGQASKIVSTAFFPTCVIP